MILSWDDFITEGIVTNAQRHSDDHSLAPVPSDQGWGCYATSDYD